MKSVKPKKSLGQHFLIDKEIAKKIVMSLSHPKNVLEIGPGTGILTEFLINKNINLKLVEIDSESVDFLIQELSVNEKIIFNQDLVDKS